MIKLNNNNSGALQDEEEELLKKKEVVTSFYHYSDLSIKNIAQQVDMPLNEIQRITDKLVKLNASRLFEEERTTRIEKIMSTNVVSLDISKLQLTTRRPGLTLSILQAVSRGKGPRCDSCNSMSEIQWCDTCNRFMCRTCEDEIHSVDLP
jgi:hypothetical protein